MSVNYLKILLDKFMVLIISMSPGIIRRCKHDTLSTPQLQLGGSKHLSMPVNLGLSTDFFKFTSMFILGKVKH